MKNKNKLRGKFADTAHFADLVYQGIACWEEAGKYVASRIDKDKTYVDRVCADYPDISRHLVLMFESIGRRKLYPRLLMSEARPGIRRLMKLPYSVQEVFCTAKVPLVTFKPTGEAECHMVDIRDLTHAGAVQVIDTDSKYVRSADHQKAYLNDQGKTEAFVPRKPWCIIKNRVVFTAGASLDKADLLALAKQLE